MKTLGLPDSIYCDGGMIKQNPSPYGGAWAWCWVRKGKRISSASGIIKPSDLGMETVSNNVMELIAAMRAINSSPPDWSGVLYTDSIVTLHRMTDGKRFKGIPYSIRLEALDLRRNRKWKVNLVAGHPTRKNLQDGFKNGAYGKVRVSEHNVFCDQLCTLRAKEFLDGG